MKALDFFAPERTESGKKRIAASAWERFLEGDDSEILALKRIFAERPAGAFGFLYECLPFIVEDSAGEVSEPQVERFPDGSLDLRIGRSDPVDFDENAFLACSCALPPATSSVVSFGGEPSKSRLAESWAATLNSKRLDWEPLDEDAFRRMIALMDGENMELLCGLNAGLTERVRVAVASMAVALSEEFRPGADSFSL